MSRSSLDGGQTDGGGPDDKTAEDVFQELADDESGLGTSADGDDIYEELSDDSPEEIIAAADETVDEPDVDEAILPDEDALDALLLSERTMADGFLWVETATEPAASEPNEDDVVEEWSEAFAEASAVGGEEGDEDGDAAAIEIEVPDPEEVDGATPDDSTAVDADSTASAGWDPQTETGPADAGGEETASGDGEEATEPSVEEEDGADGPESTDTGESPSEDEAETESASDDRDKYDRIFDVDPDEDALSGTGGDSGEEGDEDTDEDRGLLARILSLLPF